MTDPEFDEAVAAGNTRTDHLYKNEFHDGSGAFFQIVTLEDDTKVLEYEPPYPTKNRIKITATFLRESGDIKQVVVKKFKHYARRGWVEQMWSPTEPMTFTYFSFKKIAAFLRFLSEIDLASVTERRISLNVDDHTGIDSDTAGKVVKLLSNNPDDGKKIIEEVLSSGLVTSRDIAGIEMRKRQLQVFERLMTDEGYLEAYKVEHDIKGPQAEKAWQHFFKSNEWIFGYGLDYRFMGLLQDEAHVGEEDLTGSGGPIGDFLMGFRNFTVLVEVKLPGTSLFSGSNRAGSWRLSTELISAVSQILEQKASWQVKAETNAGKNYDEAGNLIQQKTVDPKAILVVGSASMFGGTEAVAEVKRRTFELFRRDSRNIEILTYDELLERARFIVSHEPSRPGAAPRPVPAFPDEPSYGGPPPPFDSGEAPTFDPPAFAPGWDDDDVPF